MKVSDSLTMAQQGSEASSEYGERRTRAEQHEAQKLIEEDKDNGASEALQWRDVKNSQMNEFIEQLEKGGLQRNKFGKYNNQVEAK
jgi:hypothetical protein